MKHSNHVYEVKDWMTPDPVTVEPEASLAEALAKLADGGFRHLPVVSGTRVVGIVSLRDLRSAFSGAGIGGPTARGELDMRELEELKAQGPATACLVGEVMSYDPLLVPPETPLEEAAETFSERGHGCLLVVDAKGTLLGILSSRDLLAALVTMLRGGPKRAGRLGELERLFRQLESERRRIRADLVAEESALRSLSLARREEPLDAGERGSLATEIVLESSLAQSAARRLAQIDRALERHARGELGVCTGCGRRIPISRLRVLPGTEFCRTCAQ